MPLLASVLRTDRYSRSFPFHTAALCCQATLRARILLLVLTLPAVTAFSQANPISIELALDTAQTQLAELETRYGSNSPELIETLEALADILMQREAFDEAHYLLDRAQQIVRVEEGLYTHSQYRLLHKKIANHMNASNWLSARQLQDHLYWLFTRRNPRPNQSLIDTLLLSSDLHLRGATQDDPAYQGYHYRRAETLNRFAIVVAEAAWSPLDPRHADLLYLQLKHSYLQALALQKPGPGGRSLRTTTDGEQYLLEVDLLLPLHRGNGYLYLQKLREFFLDREQPDNEAAAMMTLYTADWQVLFGQREQAVDSYARAHTQLLRAGVSESDLEMLFDQPALIPARELSVTVATALHKRSDRQRPLIALYDGPVQLSSHTEQPARTESLESVESFAPLASFTFRLAGLGKASPWRSGPTLGVAQDLNLIDSAIASERDQVELTENLQSFRFRPRLVRGSPAPVEGVFTYLIAID